MLKSAKATLAVVVGCLLAAGSVECHAAGKAGMLIRLTQGGKSRIETRAVDVVIESPDEARQLALDLIFFNWASAQSGLLPDVDYLEAIIAALAKTLKDPTVDWAVSYFRSGEIGPAAPMPGSEDPRVQGLIDLRTQFKSALNYKESSPTRAVSSLQAAAELCQKLFLDMSEAVILKMLGDHYSYDMARYPAAEACYERAAWTLSKVYQSRAAAAVIHDDWGTLSAQTGRYTNAKEHFAEAARLWEQLARQGPSSFKYRDLAGREFMKAGDAQMAAGDTTAALELMRGKAIVHLQNWALATKQYDELVRNLIKVGALKRTLGDAAGSLDMLKQAQKFGERQGDPLVMARIFQELGKTYSALNQRANINAAANKRARVLTDAVAAGEAALAKLARQPDVDAGALRAMAERAALASQELDDLAKSAELWRKVGEAYKQAGAIDEQLRSMRSLGSVLDAQNLRSEALEVRRESVAIARQAKMNALAAEIVRDIIQAFVAAGDLQNALEGFTELAPIFEESGNIRSAAWVLESRAAMLTSHGSYDAAISDFKDARARYLTQVGDAWAAGRVAIELADAQKLAGLDDDAKNTLETAIDDIETSYGAEVFGTGADDERSGIIASLYEKLIRLYVRTGSLDSATLAVRKLRRYPWSARTLASMRSDKSDAKFAEWMQSVDTASGDDSAVYTHVAGDRVMGDDWASFAESCWWLEEQFPREYADLPIDPLILLKSRERVPDGVVVVEYMPTDASLYVFICGRDRTVCRQVATKKGSLDALISRLRRTVKNCEESLGAGVPIPPMTDWQEASFLEIKEPLTALYLSMIVPIKASLENTQGIVFALPNGLSGVPMHALISGERASGPEFLLHDYSISYVARGMLDDLIGRTNRAIDPSKDIVSIFADPEGNLPGAEKEATKVKAAYIASKWFVGPERATVTNFIASFKEGGIIHIAAHHRVGLSPGGFEVLLASDSTSDGAIGIQELSALQSPELQLVVLSACETVGSSDPISSGPARAAEVFSLAGARSVLGGLWKVSDEAASRMMGEFYTALSKGKSRTRALQEAQLSVIESKQFAHPFYWACFALFGNPR